MPLPEILNARSLLREKTKKPAAKPKSTAKRRPRKSTVRVEAPIETSASPDPLATAPVLPEVPTFVPVQPTESHPLNGSNGVNGHSHEEKPTRKPRRKTPTPSSRRSKISKSVQSPSERSVAAA
jgi:hypothetical protein